MREVLFADAVDVGAPIRHRHDSGLEQFPVAEVGPDLLRRAPRSSQIDSTGQYEQPYWSRAVHRFRSLNTEMPAAADVENLRVITRLLEACHADPQAQPPSRSRAGTRMLIEGSTLTWAS